MTGPGVVGHSSWTVQWHTSPLAFRTVADHALHHRALRTWRLRAQDRPRLVRLDPVHRRRECNDPGRLMTRSRSAAGNASRRE
jgi:hypothetical protein